MNRGPRGRTTSETAPQRQAVPVALVTAVALAVSLGAWAFYRGGWVPLDRDTETARPDLLLVTIDTLRADRLGCYGRRDAETPVIDDLAARGVRFEESVAHVPLTLPSHASILTGLTPLGHGVRDNAGFSLAPGSATLAGWLSVTGYRTAAFVSAFTVHRRFGLAQGFSFYDDRFPRGADPARPAYVERRGDATVSAALAWLQRTGAGAPLFVWVHLFDPHAPYEPPDPFASRFEGREYDGEVAFADQQVGALLRGWRAARGRDPIVVVTSDHGEGLGEHGEPTHGLFIYDSTIRVPLVIAGPGIPAGRVPGSLARGIDVSPTMLELAGVALPASVEGRSLQGVWEGRGGRDEAAYVESLFGRLGFGWSPLHGWRDRGLMFVEAPRPELYDLHADPGQETNLADRRAEDLARMRSAVRAAVARAPEARPGAVTRDTREQLRSLGYVASGPVGTPSLRDPKDFAALAVRVESAMAVERADPARAAAELREVLKEDPDNRIARRHLAMALVAGRRYRHAEQELRTLLTEGDESYETLTLLADCQRLAGRHQEALAGFQRAIARDGAAPEAHAGVGKTLTALGRPDEARQAFEGALRVAPNDPEALEGLADLALARGDAAEARRRLDALVSHDPGDSRVALKLGVVLVRTGDVARAIGLFRGVVEREPANAEGALNLAGALAKAGRPAEAVPYFERAIAAGARGTVSWNGLAVARLEAGDRPGAAAALRESLRLNANQPGIRELLHRLR